MSSRPRFILVLLLLSVFSQPISEGEAKPPLEVAVKRQQIRNQYTRFETIIDNLDIARGMTILDIGAGPGYTSFLFAEKLRGSGRVFATDIRSDFIAYIAEEAERRKLVNLVPVLVKGEGIDDFYGEHRYDLVFLSNVYHALDNRIDYFTRLRSFLNPGARLVLVLYDQVPLFSAEDIADIEGIMLNLKTRTAGDPFIRELSQSAGKLLETSSASGSDSLKNALVADFNRMLALPLFYESFFDGSYFRKDLFSAAERDLANWLVMRLQEEGIPEKPVERFNEKDRRLVIKLNRLFFKSEFRDYLANGGMGAYLPAGDANRHISKYVMLRELDTAGYAYDRAVQLSPFFQGIIMVQKHSN